MAKKILEPFRNFRAKFLAPPLSIIAADELEVRPFNICGQIGERWVVLAPVDEPFERDVSFFHVYDTENPERPCYMVVANSRNYDQSRLIVHKYIHVMKTLYKRSQHVPCLLDFGSLGETGLVVGEDGVMIEETKLEYTDRPIAIYSHSTVPLVSLLKFSDRGYVPTVIALAVGQGVVRALATLHTAGFVHRAVSPYAFGYPTPLDMRRLQYEIVCTDFVLCLPYPSKPRRFVAFTGTPRYASPRAHAGREQGPSDDIISMIYMVAEMIYGRLPWRSIKVLAGIHEFKLHFTKSHAFKHLPRELRFLYRYVLQFNHIYSSTHFPCKCF